MAVVETIPKQEMQQIELTNSLEEFLEYSRLKEHITSLYERDQNSVISSADIASKFFINNPDYLNSILEELVAEGILYAIPTDKIGNGFERIFVNDYGITREYIGFSISEKLEKGYVDQAKWKDSRPHS